MSSASEKDISNYISSRWDTSIIPTIEEYIRIENVSPSFDVAWNTNGRNEEFIDVIWF
jgi:hypothetical protein